MFKWFRDLFKPVVNNTPVAQTGEYVSPSRAPISDELVLEQVINIECYKSMKGNDVPQAHLEVVTDKHSKALKVTCPHCWKTISVKELVDSDVYELRNHFFMGRLVTRAPGVSMGGTGHEVSVDIKTIIYKGRELKPGMLLEDVKQW